MRKLISVMAAMLILTIPVTVCAEKTSSIIVNASSVQTTIPDMANINLGINEFGKDVTDVQGLVAKKISAVKAALSDIPEDSISVTNYYVNPQYNYDSESEDYNKIVGYQVSVSIVISDVAVEDVGDLISRCTEAGANNVGNVEYKCSNYEEIYTSALSDAVRKAKRKAEVIADAAEGTLGSIIIITEGYENTDYRSNANYEYGTMKTMGVTEDAIELSPEQVEIRADITIEFRLD